MAILALPEDYSPQRKSAVERRIQQLTEDLAQREHTLILLHNDPDPDAIGSGYGMLALFKHFLPNGKCTLAHGGLIGRAENRTMADKFIPNVERIPTFEAEDKLKAYDAVILVDTQPGASNHLLYDTNYPLGNVILAVDHHPPKRSQVRAVIHDVRPEIGACATMICEYLTVAAVDIDERLATALFYGIKADTRGLSRRADELDLWAFTQLRNHINTDLLNEIEHVQLPRSYFRSLSDALAQTTLYHCDPNADPAEDAEDSSEDGQPCIGDVAISLLFDMKRPDMGAEVADLLLRLEDLCWAICLGIFEDRLVISIRSDAPEARAGRLVRSIVGRSGTAGGHDNMAGGRIHLPNATPAERVAELHALVPRFLKELGVAEAVGDPLLGIKRS
ncbi:MAG: DHH family phosphoesterase [Caldilineaceae bacterium]|nr:DHH family phosphoesterase [Caldilineaceae bacterium]